MGTVFFSDQNRYSFYLVTALVRDVTKTRTCFLMAISNYRIYYKSRVSRAASARLAVFIDGTGSDRS